MEKQIHRGLCINSAVAVDTEGVQAVADYIETELSPEEVLDAMASVILSRNRHSTLDFGGCLYLGDGLCRVVPLSLLMILINPFP